MNSGVSAAIHHHYNRDGLIALNLTKPGFPQKWTFEPHVDIRSVGIACCDVVNRSAVYAAGKIIYNALDAYTVAVDSAHSIIVKDFV